MKKSTIVGIIVVVLIIIVISTLSGSYNEMVSKKEAVDNAFSNLDVMLQRRGDLIPNLVSTVKGYTNHETDIITKITDARAKLSGANTVEEKSAADTELSGYLKSLMVIVENYPDLKSSENFTQLSDQLEGTENRIAVARKDYNDAVKTYNTTIIRFPNNLFANMFGLQKASYFEADESSSKVPSVSF